jgi:hypothetical protein
MRRFLHRLAVLFALTAAAAAEDPWALWTNGASLRGANIYQRRVYPSLDGTSLGPGPVGPPHTQQDFNLLAAQGANYVNISHPGLYTEQPPYVLDVGAQSNLDAMVGMADSAGLHAVISFRTGPGRSEFSILRDGAGVWFPAGLINDSVWTDRAAQDAWVDMWRHTAQRYRGRRAVCGFDLMVEPNADDAVAKTYDPEVFYRRHGGSLLDWNQLHPRIASAIRSVDPETPILVGGEDYSSLDWMPWLRTNGASRVVYTAHQYGPDAYTHQDAAGPKVPYVGVYDADDDGDADAVNAAWLAARFRIAADFRTRHRVPVAINEFGCVRWAPNAAQFLDHSMSALESFGINYALWMWHPAWPPVAGDDDFDFFHGVNPAAHTDAPANPLMQVIARHWRGEAAPPRVLDFEGDAFSDFAVYQPASGNWFVLSVATRIPRVFNWGWSETSPVAADYDGDGTCDAAVFHPASGTWFVLRSADGKMQQTNWGWSEVKPVPADYDGDGKADLAVYHAAAGNWFLFMSSDRRAVVRNWGWSAATPVPSDYDGDGKTDLAVFYPVTGTWYILSSRSGGMVVRQLGGVGYLPAPSDYDGDRSADLAVWRPSSGSWIISRSADGAVANFTMGSRRALPAPADFDGDGFTDAAVYETSKGAWLYRSSLFNATLSRAWGASGMIPVRQPFL